MVESLMSISIICMEDMQKKDGNVLLKDFSRFTEDHLNCPYTEWPKN